jgi:hypothetical protein
MPATGIRGRPVGVTGVWFDVALVLSAPVFCAPQLEPPRVLVQQPDCPDAVPGNPFASLTRFSIPPRRCHRPA